MLTIEPLNDDSSWLIRSEKLHILLDPWLTGPQVDGFRIFSRQSHRFPCVPISSLPAVDGIIITHPFTDHMHIETIRLIAGNPVIVCDPTVYGKLKNKVSNPFVVLRKNIIAEVFPGLEVGIFPSEMLFNSVHKGLYIRRAGEEFGLFYAPHGFVPSRNGKLPFQVHTLISTITTYKLFFVPGGKINLGLKNAEDLITYFSPQQFLNTHDEDKIAEGIVALTAHVQRNIEWDSVLSQKFPLLNIHRKTIGTPIKIN